MPAFIEAIYSIFEWVIGTSIQASLLFVIIFVLQLILRNRINAQWRYILWLLLLIRLSLPWAPATSLSVYNILPRQPTGQNTVSSVSILESSPAASQTTLEISQPEAILLEYEKGTNHQKPSGIPDNIGVIFWLIGVIVMSGFVLYQSGTLIVRLSGKRPVTNKKTLDLLEDCKELMGIHTYLAVVETSKIKSPVLLGWLRPRLLLPEGSFDTLSRNQLHHIFIHELSHLKRSDILVNYWMTVLQVINWFNPLIWIACYLVRNEQEMACDGLALSYIKPTENADYGKTLLRFLQKYSHHQYLPVMAGILENKNQIKRRIQMIAAFKRHSRQFSIIMMCVLLLSTTFVLTNAKEDKPPKASHSEMSKNDDLTERAKLILNSIVKGDFLTPVSFFDLKMKSALTPHKLKTTWDTVVMNAGPYKKIIDIRKDNLDGYDLIILVCELEKKNCRFKVLFNNKAEVAGLFVVPVMRKDSHAKDSNKEIQQLVLNWLSLIDQNKYDKSYIQMAQMARQQVTSVQWTSLIQIGRQQFGLVETRELINIGFENPLPGLPPGEYCVVQYQTKLEKFKSPIAVETVTLFKEDTGWRVAGYTIQ